MEIYGSRRISGKPKVARRSGFKGDAAILAGSNQIPYFRWSTLMEAENKQAGTKSIGKHRVEIESNESCAGTEWALWKRRNVMKGS
jgi:hypothetical protein